MRRTARRQTRTLRSWPAKPTVGFLTLVVHSARSAEVHLMAVDARLHRKGIGRALLEEAERRLRQDGIEYLQVKTLSSHAPSEPYSRRRRFYEATGFRVLEEMPTLWDDDNRLSYSSSDSDQQGEGGRIRRGRYKSIMIETEGLTHLHLRV